MERNNWFIPKLQRFTGHVNWLFVLGLKFIPVSQGPQASMFSETSLFRLPSVVPVKYTYIQFALQTDDDQIQIQSCVHVCMFYYHLSLPWYVYLVPIFLSIKGLSYIWVPVIQVQLEWNRRTLQLPQRHSVALSVFMTCDNKCWFYNDPTNHIIKKINVSLFFKWHPKLNNPQLVE